jgi:hypothetical protein
MNSRLFFFSQGSKTLMLTHPYLFFTLANILSTYLLVYVDDLIIIGDDVHLVNRFINLLAHRFSLKDLGQLSYFLGIEILPTKQGFLLSQRRYLFDLLIRTHMKEAKSVFTPLPSGTTLSLNSGNVLPDPIEFHSIIGSLQYLLLTRLDIAYAVNKLSQFMHKRTTEH